MRTKIKIIWPIDYIAKRVHDGATLKTIGEEIGCSNQQVSRICKKLDIKTHRVGPRSGDGHPEWKGGCLIDKNGYILVYKKNHPMARHPRKCYVPEHRLVMSENIGRTLERHEVVHHINGKKDDNRLENLKIYSSNSEHLAEDLKGRIPKWTDDGKRRLRSGVEKRANIYRKKPVTNAYRKPQSECHF